jgi:hypothetical protein
MLIDELSQLAADVLLPDASPDLDSLFDKKNPDLLRVPLEEPDAFRRRLTASGWFEDEILAGALVTQGRKPSVASMLTGWALVELVKARRCKWLPREFCLAVTGTRVIALALSPWSEGTGETSSTDVVVKVKRGEIESWPRGGVRVDGDTLVVRDGERVPVTWSEGSEAEELIAFLAR